MIAIQCLCDHCIDAPLGPLPYVIVLLVVWVGGAILAGWVSRRTVSGPLAERRGSLGPLDVVFAARDALLFSVLGLGLGQVTALGQPVITVLPQWVVPCSSVWMGAFLMLLGLRVHAPASINHARFGREVAVTLLVFVAPLLATEVYSGLLCRLHGSGSHCEYRSVPWVALTLAGGLASSIGSLVGRGLGSVPVSR